MRLREIYKDYGRFKSQAGKLQAWLLKNFDSQTQISKFNSIINEYFVESISDEEIDDLFNKISQHT